MRVFISITMLLLFLSIPNLVYAFSSSEFKSMGGLSLCAADQEKLVTWYEQFGFKLEKYGLAFRAIEGQKGSSFIFSIYPAGQTGQFCKIASNAGFGFFLVVDDLPSKIQRLKAKGIGPERIIEHPDGKFAIFRDPEGNHLNLWQKNSDG